MCTVLEGEEEVHGGRMKEVIKTFYEELYGGSGSAQVEEIEEYCQMVRGGEGEPEKGRSRGCLGCSDCSGGEKCIKKQEEEQDTWG